MALAQCPIIGQAIVGKGTGRLQIRIFETRIEPSIWLRILRSEVLLTPFRPRINRLPWGSLGQPTIEGQLHWHFRLGSGDCTKGPAKWQKRSTEPWILTSFYRCDAYKWIRGVHSGCHIKYSVNHHCWLRCRVSGLGARVFDINHLLCLAAVDDNVVVAEHYNKGFCQTQTGTWNPANYVKVRLYRGLTAAHIQVSARPQKTTLQSSRTRPRQMLTEHAIDQTS
jgi:hypothetical protein